MPDPHFEKLNEMNYNDWRYVMAAMLVEKDLWDVVDGTETQPAGSANSKAVRAFAKKQQLAHAKLILNIDKSQLPHTRYDDPKEIWESLQKVHQARGFATRLSLRRCFLYMRKRDDQPMVSWISAVKNAAFQLEAAGVTIIDEDVILALTEGLPESYSTLIVALDSIPADDLTLDIVITRLLNEEVRQVQAAKSESERMEGALAAIAKKKKTPIAEITCYNCDGKGHYQNDCPSARRGTATLADAGEEDDEGFAF
jgi:gag-polypeptide of LTR copia-type/Zinc knuckle